MSMLSLQLQPLVRFRFQEVIISEGRRTALFNKHSPTKPQIILQWQPFRAKSLTSVLGAGMSSSSITELFGVQGRVALVTGGTSGVGLMIAGGFVSNGVKTYVTGLASDDIEGSVAELNKMGQESGGQAIG